MFCNLDAAQDKYDAQMPEDSIDDEDHVSVVPADPTDDDVENWIRGFAVTGAVVDDLGMKAFCTGSINHRIAIQWVADKSKMEFVGPEFWRYAKSMWRMEQFGK